MITEIVELTTTRHNPHVDPVMAMWEWQIPVYLFLGGMVAGMMIICRLLFIYRQT